MSSIQLGINNSDFSILFHDVRSSFYANDCLKNRYIRYLGKISGRSIKNKSIPESALNFINYVQGMSVAEIREKIVPYRLGEKAPIIAHSEYYEFEGRVVKATVFRGPNDLEAMKHHFINDVKFSCIVN